MYVYYHTIQIVRYVYLYLHTHTQCYIYLSTIYVYILEHTNLYICVYHVGWRQGPVSEETGQARKTHRLDTYTPLTILTSYQQHH